MTRAHVLTDYIRPKGIAIYLVENRPDGGTAVGEPIEIVMADVSDIHVAVDRQPTLRIPEHVARALLDGLAAHFGGTSDVQTLRKDYLAERQRVDKLIDHLTGGTAR